MGSDIGDSVSSGVGTLDESEVGSDLGTVCTLEESEVGSDLGRYS